ncbi:MULTISPECIES: GNAT family N-acetyltransferase [Streptomyces]|uniref:Protein N-acetyltransferase, RimJ/RimL family n=2 Tax=Streptomyces TaxID=1883 RepID=A0A1I6PV53_9ACTN|nr:MULTISPECIES: GNAT family N-acetyltransferase [Streptomyces]SFS44111.1 Protein N-acetyltransferase, RimJ/RimL family [Streptomyces harbinensis]
MSAGSGGWYLSGMLTGDLVRLRAMEPEDAEALWRWNHDPQVMRWLDTSYPQSLAQTRRRVEEREPNSSYERLLLAIETRDEGRLIGVTCLRDFEAENGMAVLDIYLGEKDAWGQGHGTDAVRTLCRYGFDQLRLHSITLWVVADNAAARRAYAKAGFTEDGRQREGFRRDGRWYDLILMTVLEHELRPPEHAG